MDETPFQAWELPAEIQGRKMEHEQGVGRPTWPAGRPTTNETSTPTTASNDHYQHSSSTPRRTPVLTTIPEQRAPLDDEERKLAALCDEPIDLIRRRRFVLEERLAACRQADPGPVDSPATERLVTYLAAHRVELRRRRQAERDARCPWARWVR